MIEDGRVVHEVRYPHPVERVWRALTDRAELAAWLMPNDFEPVVGHRYRLDARPAFDVLDCEVLELEPLRRLQCRWRVGGVDSLLTILLEREGPDGGSTLLRLVHDLIPPDRIDGFDGGWDSKLHHDLPLVLDGTRAPNVVTVDADALTRHPDLEV